MDFNVLVLEKGDNEYNIFSCWSVGLGPNKYVKPLKQLDNGNLDCL